MTGNAIVLPLAVKWRHLLKDKRWKWCEKMFHITYDKQQCFRKLTIILFPILEILLEFERFLVKVYLIVIIRMPMRLVIILISDYIQQNIHFLGQKNLWTLFAIRTLADWSLSYFQSHICKTIFEYAWEISTIWRQITMLDFVFGSKFLALHLRNRPTKN